MEFNLIRVVAQLINFLLLVWLLRRFLFGPITAIMKAREDRIKDGLERGRHLQAEAREAKALYEEHLAGLKAGEQQLMREAREEAKTVRAELMAEAQREVEAARRKFVASLEQQQQEANVRLHREIVSHSCRLAGRVLEQLAGVSLDERAVEIVLDRLAEENGEVEPLRRALAAGEPAIIHSHGELPTAVRGKLVRGLSDLAGGDVELEFHTDGELICGLRITAAGATVDWNASSHLARVESTALRTLSVESGVEGADD